MKANRETLIRELTETTKQNLTQLQALKECSTEQLNLKTNLDSWSILECIKHLNIYGNFYLPEIEKSIFNASKSDNSTFKAGILGNYFVKLIEPKDKLNTMKTMSKFNPLGSSLTETELTKFEQQQYKTLELLSQALTVDLTKNKTSTSLSKIINMRLGDTLRFVIAHNQRHLIQAKSLIN
jgi:uncharacterized damage-inducible protein DinB